MASSQEGQPHFLASKHIIVSGAGISGLAFALSLHKLWPSISTSPPPRLTLYERDACAVPPGREGYSLSLRSDRPSAGMQTLQKMGLLERMLERSISIPGSGNGEDGSKGKGGFCVWDKEFKVVMKVQSKTPEGLPVSGMRIARAELKRTLVEGVEGLSGVEVKWDEAVTSVSSTDDDAIQVETSKGGKEICDFLIAADGSSSRLRTLLRPHDTLNFAGATCIYGTVPISEHHPSGRNDEFGSAVSGTGVGLFIAPVDAMSMIWCLSYLVPAPPTLKKAPLSASDREKLRQEARRIGGPAYGDNFLKMLDDTDAKSLTHFNAMDKQPFAHTAQYITSPDPDVSALNGRILFLGDANHAVSPFAGNGANLALMDGWDFAESLLQSSNLEEATRRYDTSAVGRAKKVIAMSHFSIRVMHSKGWWTWFWMGVLRIIRFVFFKSAD